jgi:hypothetical protein
MLMIWSGSAIVRRNRIHIFPIIFGDRAENEINLHDSFSY